MGYIRNAQPAPISLPGLKVEAYGTATAVPIGISADRKTIYGTAAGYNTALQQSIDDGATWTAVHTFPQGIEGVVETDDGEALAIAHDAANSPGYLYKSTGWAASHTTATWALVLTTVGGYIRPYWAGGHTWTFGDDSIRANTSRFGVVSEYGGQTTASGDQTAKARRVYVTNDYGTTWTQVFDLAARYPAVANQHVHATAYDPYWDRIWLTYGDGGVAEGTTQHQVLYSDDRGVTWNSLPALPGDANLSAAGSQSTTIAVLPDCIIFGADNRPGYYRLPRKGYRKVGQFTVQLNLAGGSGDLMLACRLHRNRKQNGAPLLGGYNSDNSLLVPGGLVASLDAGQTVTLLWQDTALTGGYRGPINVFGPTYNGKIVATVAQTTIGSPGSGTPWLLRGQLVIPDAGLLDGTYTVTGDGATTAFSIPHGLPAQPSRYVVWEEKPAGAYTVGVTATNIVLTFTAAPVNAATIPFQWRAGV